MPGRSVAQASMAGFWNDFCYGNANASLCTWQGFAICAEMSAKPVPIALQIFAVGVNRPASSCPKVAESPTRNLV